MLKLMNDTFVITGSTGVRLEGLVLHGFKFNETARGGYTILFAPGVQDAAVNNLASIFNNQHAVGPIDFQLSVPVTGQHAEIMCVAPFQIRLLPQPNDRILLNGVIGGPGKGILIDFGAKVQFHAINTSLPSVGYQWFVSATGPVSLEV